MPTGKLATKIFLAYGFAEFSLGFLTTMGVQYIAFFLTDTALIAPAVVAMILLIGRVVDVCDVPIIGMVVEKSNLPWGKYRSWLFIAPVFIVLFNMLMFTNFNVSTPVKVIYMSLAYILAYVFVNLASTSRFALLPTFTSDQDERAKLAARRGQGLALRNIVGGATVVPLIAFLGRGNNAQGYFYTVIIFGTAVIAGLFWLAVLAKDYDKPSTNKSKKSVSVKEMLTAIGTNKPLLILMLSDIFRQTATNILVGFGLYYFRYVVGNLMLFSLYLPITFAGGFLGNTLSNILSKKYDKKATYMSGIAIWFSGMVMVYLFAGGSAPLFMACITIAQFGAGIANGLIQAFYSDTADYGEWKTGKSTRAVNMGLVLFPIKIGVLVGGSIAAFSLAAIGFHAGTKDPAIINSIRTMVAVLPAITSILAIVFMYFYPLNREKVDTLQLEIKQRTGIPG